MNMLKCCFNPKVLAGLAAVGVGLLIFAPGLLASALPLLLILVCPLSMLFMMKGMASMGSRGAQQAGVAGQYTCPMHRDVQSDQPGRCPKCGMHLTSAAPAQVRPAASDGRTREQQVADLKAELARVQAQQDAIAGEVARIEAEEDTAAVREAEVVARAADGRGSDRP